MCSVLGILEVSGDPAALRDRALAMSRRQRHRGPDWSGIHIGKRAVLVHERLAIVDVDNGAQPLFDETGRLSLAVNGEIYNHVQLRARLRQPYTFRTASDCEIILALYREGGSGFLNELNGIFAFVLYDEHNDDFLIARDPIGVVPLYIGRDDRGQLWVASEMKALLDVCKTVEVFPPGHYRTRATPKPVRYYDPPWREYAAVQHRPVDHGALREALEQAVHRQLMCDVPYGVLLSGGLDSSLIAAITGRFARQRIEDDDRSEAWWPRLHSFSIGLAGSPDLAAARVVAEALGTVHHEIVYTVQSGIDALRDVIYHLETYDLTTIRASTPMYMMARRIKAMGIKMVLTGEGADEVFGGYLYFHKAPDAIEFHAETVRKLDQLHLFDCLRANKSMAAWGVEARVPFLDRQFLDVAMAFDAQHKMVASGGIEKFVLRKAFEGALPERILYRQKEQFSDGVGYGWIDGLKLLAAREVQDDMFRAADARFPINTPLTKEAYFYRQIFEEHFPGAAAARTVPGGKSIACSTPAALAWDQDFARRADPSGRAVLGIHRAAKDPSD